MTDAPPGWHPDPWAPATCALLWWDGVRWTEHVTIPGAGAGAGDVPPVATDSGAVEPVEPVDGPRALSDEAVDLLFEGLVADYRFRWRFFSFGDAWFSGYEPESFEDHTEAFLVEVQRRLPVGEPPLDLRHVETGRDSAFSPMIVVTGRRVLVLSSARIEAGERPDVAEAPLERVQVVAGNAKLTGTAAGLYLPLDREGRAWFEAFRSGPRTLQGRLADLMSRPHRDPSQPPADWYPDPDGQAGWRFWDGVNWTGDVHRGR